jgi:NitT/TauT family transport system substrate-binding protein
VKRNLIGRIAAFGAAILIAVTAFAPIASAETSEVRVARQYGIGYLTMMIMEDQKLIEKAAAAAGIPNLKVTWATFAGGNVMNDALLSGSLDFAAGGVGPFVTLWGKTRGNYNVRSVGALNSMPLYLNTRNPNAKTLKDLTEKDKIGLPAVKVSIQAVTLQMAAEQAFGPGKQNELDRLTVTLSHPDAMAALLSNASEVNAHFGSPPFQEQELADPRVHRLINSYDVLGGPATFNLMWAGAKFRDENPKVYAAFIKAHDEAREYVNKNRRGAAEAYLRMSKDKSSVDDIVKMLDDPLIVFTDAPQNLMKYVAFMLKVGSIKEQPASWKDLFFDNIHGQPGS